MKMLLVALVSLTCLVGRLQAQVTNFLWGSRAAVEQNAVNRGLDLFVTVTMQDGQLVGCKSWGNVKFKDKDALDRQFKLGVARACNGALTNQFGTDAILRKDEPFILYGEYVRWDPDVYNEVHYFWCYRKFRLVKTPDGQYHLPDLTGFTLDFPTEIAFKVPDLTWARVEISDSDGIVRISDSNIPEPYSMALAKWKALAIPTEYALSGTNGPYRMRVSIVSGVGNKFQVFGPMGDQIPELQPTLEFVHLAGAKPQGVAPTQTVRVEGGEIGRTYKVQSTIDLKTWLDTGESLTKSPSNSPSFVLGTKLEDSVMYRLLAVDTVPDYTK